MCNPSLGHDTREAPLQRYYCHGTYYTGLLLYRVYVTMLALQCQCRCHDGTILAWMVAIRSFVMGEDTTIYDICAAL